jgi:hypothetical protein
VAVPELAPADVAVPELAAEDVNDVDRAVASAERTEPDEHATSSPASTPTSTVSTATSTTNGHDGTADQAPRPGPAPNLASEPGNARSVALPGAG